MNHESFLLKWKFHQNSVDSAIRGEAQENKFADVTLVSDDMIEFTVHKSVLSACSTVMKQILLQNPHDHPLIYLNGVKEETLHNFLQLVYFGEATLSFNLYEESVENFLKTIEEFKLTNFNLPMINKKQQPSFFDIFNADFINEDFINEDFTTVEMLK